MYLQDKPDRYSYKKRIKKLSCEKNIELFFFSHLKFEIESQIFKFGKEWIKLYFYQWDLNSSIILFPIEHLNNIFSIFEFWDLILSKIPKNFIFKNSFFWNFHIYLEIYVSSLRC